MNEPAIVERLKLSGHELPKTQAASYSYEPVVTAAGLAFVSGQVPKRDGSIVWQGAVGEELSVEDGIRAAEVCTLNVLAQIGSEVGFDNVERLVKLTVYVASAEDFEDQPTVAEGASKLLRDALGEEGRHSRTAIGVPKLPKNSSVEIEAIFSIAT